MAIAATMQALWNRPYHGCVWNPHRFRMMSGIDVPLRGIHVDRDTALM
jgi:hypothetical protein